MHSIACLRPLFWKIESFVLGEVGIWGTRRCTNVTPSRLLAVPSTVQFPLFSCLRVQANLQILTLLAAK
jgi:hypothetical protein